MQNAFIYQIQIHYQIENIFSYHPVINQFQNKNKTLISYIY